MTATPVQAVASPYLDVGVPTGRPREPSWRNRWAALTTRSRRAALALALGLAVFATTLGTLRVLSPPSLPVAWWWPVAGLSVGAVALTSGRYRQLLLAVIAVSSLLGSLAAGRPLALALCFAAADLAEAWVAGTWLSRGRLLKLETFGDLTYLAAVSAVGGLLAGVIDVVGVAVVMGGDQWWVLPVAAFAHATGVLLVVPLGIRRPAHMVAVSHREFVLQWIVTLALTIFVFAPTNRLPVPFLVLFILVWTSLRQGGRTAAAQMLVVGSLATVFTAHAHGPFPGSNRISLTAESGGAALQTFLLICTLTVLLVALTAAQRQAALAVISANEHFLNTLVETMDVGVLAVDANAGVTLINRACRELMGPLRPRPDDGPLIAERFSLFRADGVTLLEPDEVPFTMLLAGKPVRGIEVVAAPPKQPPKQVVVNGRQIHAPDGTLLGGVLALQDVTVLKQHELQLNAALETLAEEREFERAVLEVVNAGVLACDAAGTVRLRNGAQRRLMGSSNSESLERALAGEVITDLPGQLGDASSPQHDVLITARQVHAQDGRLLGAVAAFTDVTAEKVVEAELRESAAFHDALLAATPDVTYITDVASNRVVWTSANIVGALGYTALEVAAMGGNVIDALVHPDDIPQLSAAVLAIRDLADGATLETRYRIRVKGGTFRWVSRRATPFNREEDGRVRQFLSLARDITDKVLAEDQLTQAALHDPLTGLPNRRLLADRLDVALKRSARSGGEVAVLFCDLDGFKRVNDVAGHAAGDVVLTETAARLMSVVRPQDTVARVGGDEFVIVVDLSPPTDTELSEAPVTGQEQALAVAGRITTALSAPVDINGVAYSVTVSIGITFARAGDDADEALRDADTAMYQAKTHGKHRTEIFNNDLRAGGVERRRVIQLLRAALAEFDQVPSGLSVLSAAYQPIVDLGSRQIVGLEALARLTDAEGNRIAPREFIAIAEESGLIFKLGQHMLEIACRDLARWRAAHPDQLDLGVSVNLSAGEAAHRDLVAGIRAVLARHGLDAGNLTLEVTENLLLQAGRSTLASLRELATLGVKIDLDNFGTSFSAAQNLLQFPVTGLKIDSSLVAGHPDQGASGTVLRAVAGMARDLGLSCVAEGVDTQLQLSALPAGLAGQGCLLGPPVPASEIDARLGRTTAPKSAHITGR
jgi:diguanylate cyclase (GGDEF)-like protein/PAS domain S-box-containing protein